MSGRPKKDRDHQKKTAQAFDEYRRRYRAQLNPLDYPGCVSLVYELDMPVLVVTQSGMNIVGELASYDRYLNIVLTKAHIVEEVDGVISKTFFGALCVREADIIYIGRINDELSNEILGRKSGPQRKLHVCYTDLSV